MFRLDDTVVSDESQASQLLRDALRGPPAPIHRPVSRRAAKEIESLDAPTAPLNIPPSNTQYSYVGLADTQSQIQHTPVSSAPKPAPQYDNEVRGGGKAVDNRAGGRQVHTENNLVQYDKGGIADELPPNLSAGCSKKEGQRKSLLSDPSTSRSPRSRIRVRATTAPSRSPPRRGRQRKDSFAGVLPAMDQANAFIRDSAVFCKPLSKLGIDSQTEGGLVENCSVSSSPSVSHMLLRGQSMGSPGIGPHYPSSYYVPDSDNSQTAHSQNPHLSGGQRQSQSQSSPPGYTQGFESLHGQGQESGSEDFRTAAFGTQSSEPDYEPTEPSRSFHYEPTQIEYEATQPSEVDDPYANLQQGASSHPLTHAIPDLPGILSLVDPAKPWRRRATHARDSIGIDSKVADGTVLAPTQDYPTYEENTQTDGSETPSEPTQPAYAPKSRSYRAVRTRPGPPSFSVVPDSEVPSMTTYQNTIPASVDTEDWRASEPCDDAPDSLVVSTKSLRDQVDVWQTSELCDMDNIVSGLPAVSGIATEKSPISFEAQTQQVETTAPLKSLQEEDEESEDERPLASAPKKRRLSRRVSVAQMPPPKVASSKRRRVLAKESHNESADTLVVPSSDPQQDFPKGRTARLKPKPGVRNAQPAARIAYAGALTCSRPDTAMKSPTSSPLTSDHEITASGYLPSALDQCEAATELADDDYIDIERQLSSTTASRKRKRALASTRTAVKHSNKLSKAMSTTPLSAKRLRVSSSTSRSVFVDATRVFALWKQDAHYYSGVVYAQPDRSLPQYLVNFDDDTQDTVDLGNLRQCTLVKGDSVMLNQFQRKARVVHASGDRVTVQINGDNDPMELHLRDVRVAAGTVRNDWNDRKIALDQVVPVMRPKSLAETPSKMSLASAGSTLSGHMFKMLSGIGLVVTLSPGTSEWESQKSQVMNAIKTKGGTVMEDWNEVFNLDGKVEKSGKRWVARKEDVTIRRNLDNVFLISDAPHQKPKYLMALALGIPCVSSDWLVNEDDLKTWQSYLLAAGFSTQLHYRMSQLVNLDWGDEDRHLERIVYNVAPVKVFADKSILYVSPDFVPQPKGRKTKTDAAQTQEANRSIPKILLCMGAKRVEAVAVEADASQAPRAFDYVVVKEPAEVHQFSVKGATCVHFKWVKDCLFSGRILSLNFNYSA